MIALQKIYRLVQHAIRVEIRNKHGILGLLIFAIAAVYVCYQTTGSSVHSESWNALIWVVLLFTAFNAVSKPWADDSAGLRSVLFHTVSPQHWILARILYYSLMLCAMGAAVFLGFVLFLGLEPFKSSSALHFFLGVELTALALAALLALIQAIASRAGGGFSLISVLGLPLIIPIILISTRFGSDLISGMAFADTAHHLLFLATLTSGFVALGYILFPYLWRD